MIRIAYHVSTIGFGGMEQHLLVLLAHLDRTQFAPMVYFRCTDPAGDRRMRQELTRLAVPVSALDEDGLPLSPSSANGLKTAAHQAPAQPKVITRRLARLAPPSLKQAWYYWSRCHAAARTLRRAHVQVLHVLHGRFPSHELILVAGRLAGIPIRLCDIRQEPAVSGRQSAVRGMLRWLALRSMTRACVLSERAARQLAVRCPVPPGRITVIPGGIELDRFAHAPADSSLRQELGIPSGHRVVVMIARLSKEKGHAVLIDAIAALRAGDLRAHFLFVGEGPLEGPLKQLVAERGLHQEITFLGFRADVPRLLQASDMVVLPSLVEGMPVTLLEAMAAGKPVVATDVGIVSEVITDRLTGRVVPSRNPRALAEALNELLTIEASVLRRMGLAARQRVGSFSQARMLKSTLGLYAVGGARA